MIHHSSFAVMFAKRLPCLKPFEGQNKIICFCFSMTQIVIFVRRKIEQSFYFVDPLSQTLLNLLLQWDKQIEKKRQIKCLLVPQRYSVSSGRQTRVDWDKVQQYSKTICQILVFFYFRESQITTSYCIANFDVAFCVYKT